MFLPETYILNKNLSVCPYLLSERGIQKDGMPRKRGPVRWSAQKDRGLKAAYCAQEDGKPRKRRLNFLGRVKMDLPISCIWPEHMDYSFIFSFLSNISGAIINVDKIQIHEDSLGNSDERK